MFFVFLLGVSVLNGQCFFNLGGPGGSFGGPGGGFGGPGGGFFSTGSSSGLPLLLPVLKPPPGPPKPPPGPPKPPPGPLSTAGRLWTAGTF